MTGGVFQIREKKIQAYVRVKVANIITGDAHFFLFPMSCALLTPVTGAADKIAFAGWFRRTGIGKTSSRTRVRRRSKTFLALEIKLP